MGAKSKKKRKRKSDSSRSNSDSDSSSNSSSDSSSDSSDSAEDEGEDNGSTTEKKSKKTKDKSKEGKRKKSSKKSSKKDKNDKKDKEKSKKKKKDKKKKKKSKVAVVGPTLNNPMKMATWNVECVFRWATAFAGPHAATQLKSHKVDGERLSKCLNDQWLSDVFEIPMAPATLLYRAVMAQLRKEELHNQGVKSTNNINSEASFGQVSGRGLLIDSSAGKGGWHGGPLTAAAIESNERRFGGSRVCLTAAFGVGGLPRD